MSDPHKNNLDFISQIDKLNLPKRAEKRRVVYINEALKCLFVFGPLKLEASVVDISRNGMALVLKKEISNEGIIGKQVTVQFLQPGSKESFAVKCVVNHKAHVSYGHVKYLRIGLSFILEGKNSFDEFLKEVKESHFLCKGFIRPQAHCKNPFFFNDVAFLHVEGFTSKGVILGLTPGSSELIPGQRVALNIFFPGRELFAVIIKLTTIRYYSAKAKMSYCYAEHVNPSKEYLEALSEHLILTLEEATPKKLRDLSFTVGNLENSFFLTYAEKESAPYDLSHLVPSVMGIPLALPSQEKKMNPKSRKLVCHLGKTVVCVCSLVFVDASQDSNFKKNGHSLPSHVLEEKFVELCDFWINDQTVLADFFIPLLQHMVRIAHQDKRTSILIEGHDAIKPILKKVGFKETKSVIRLKEVHGKEFTSILFELSTSHMLEQKKSALSEQIWNKVYRDLTIFFTR